MALVIQGPSQAVECNKAIRLHVQAVFEANLEEAAGIAYGDLNAEPVFRRILQALSEAYQLQPKALQTKYEMAVKNFRRTGRGLDRLLAARAKPQPQPSRYVRDAGPSDKASVNKADKKKVKFQQVRDRVLEGARSGGDNFPGHAGQRAGNKEALMPLWERRGRRMRSSRQRSCSATLPRSTTYRRSSGLSSTPQLSWTRGTMQARRCVPWWLPMQAAGSALSTPRSRRS